MEYITYLENPIYKLRRFSRIKQKQENQRSSVKLYYQFMSTIFGPKLGLFETCRSHSLKRSLCPKDFENQQLKPHFEKIEQVSRYIGSALITKDIFSAFMQGHFDEVAFNFGLIASSSFFGKISNNLFTQGEILAAKTHVLEKNPELKNKVFDILFNEEVLTTSKRQFLGKALKVASPFVTKTTSIFFAYNLKNEILAYKTGEKTVLPNIISNSIILSVDGIEAGIKAAEFLEIIAGVSAFTGPIGEGITILTWIGTDVYIAKQQVKAIEQYVHLSRGEKLFNFLLAALHQDPLEYLQIKADNGQRVEQAINFLKSNPTIQRYIFPANHFSADLCKIRKVFLDEKRGFTPDENNPDEPDEGNLFCLSASPPSYFMLNNKNLKTTYLCHKALGVSYTLNRTGNVTLVSLGEGEDEVIAFPHSPSLFHLQNGKKEYIGGDSGNVFNLQGNYMTGSLQGGKGFDLLALDNFYPENSNYLLLDINRFLCGKNDSLIQQIPPLCPEKSRIQIDKIEQINGRKNEADFLYLSPHTYVIDGKGAKNKERPDSFFITDHSPKNLKITLRNNTRILFYSNTVTDSVDYSIPLNEVGEVWILYYFTKPIQHRFFFECSLQDIGTITINNNKLLISVLADKVIDRKVFTVTLSGHSFISNSNQTKNMEENLKNIFFLFKNIELKLITYQHLIGHELIANSETIDQKINLFKMLAHRLEKSFSIQLINNVSLSIGLKNKHEIFYINSLFENHLVGNGGENAYIILANNKTVFPIPKITLYENLTTDLNDELTNSLDLREIIKEYKKIYSNVFITSHVYSVENDLILTLSNAIYSPINYASYDADCFSPWATIQFKGVLLNNTNGYQKLDVLLDSIPKNIVPVEDNFWTLTAAPIIFNNDKKIILITYQDIEEETRFEILKNIGISAFFSSESDLILTNAMAHSGDYCTIICHEFYTNLEMRKKVLSAIFKFYDHEIRPQNYQNEIEYAPNIKYLSKIFLTNTSDPVFSHLFLNSIYKITSVDQKQLLPQIVRHKRQVNLKEEKTTNTIQKLPSIYKKVSKEDQTFFPEINHYSHSITDKKDPILVIADDYLEKYDHARSKNKTYYSKKNIKQKKNKKKNLSLFSSTLEKTKPIIENPHFFKQKNKEKHLLSIKQRKLVHNKLNWVEKSQSKNKSLIIAPFQSKPTIIKKDNFFNLSNVKKGQKDAFMPNNALAYQNSGKLNRKTSSIVAKLTYEKTQSSSKKPNSYSATSYIESPNLHSTLMFTNYIIEAAKGRPASISYNKKLKKTFKKAQKFKEKIKFEHFSK